MKYECRILCRDSGGGNLYSVIEKDQIQNSRSALSIKKEQKSVVFDIQAKDAIALKASVSSVIKTLTVYEKTKKLVENG